MQFEHRKYDTELVSTVLNTIYECYNNILGITKEDREIWNHIYSTQINQIQKSYTKGIKIIVIWLFLLCIFLNSVYFYTGMTDDPAGLNFVIQVVYFMIYLVICFIIVQFYAPLILYLIPLSIFITWFVTVNICTGSPEYAITEWVVCVSSLVFLMALIAPGQWAMNSFSFMLSMGYFLFEMYYHYEKVPVPLKLSCCLATGYFSLGCYLYYTKFRTIYKTLFENKKLIAEMKRVNEIFPESVLIRTESDNPDSKSFYTNQKCKESVLSVTEMEEYNYANILKALKEIKVSIEKPEAEPSDSSGDRSIRMSLHHFLKTREKDVKGDKIIESTCKVLPVGFNMDGQDSITDEESETKTLSVKTLKVNWEENPNAFMHVLIDTTDIHKLEKANNSIRCQKIMFASASHEFRTPLNAVLNSFNLIKLTLEGHPEFNKETNSFTNNKLKKFLKMGSNSATLLLSLIEDILNLSKIETGNFSVHNSWFCLSDLIEEVFDIFYFQCEQKNVKLEIVLDKNLEQHRVFSDRGRIKQVFLNLISNSLKFTFDGSIIIGARSVKSLTSNDSFIEFSVQDSGVGIKEEDQTKLFTLFGMVSRSKKLNPNGCGIGLTVSKKYIEHLGGKMELKSKYGIGTKVTFLIKDIRMRPSQSMLSEFDRNEKEGMVRIGTEYEDSSPALNFIPYTSVPYQRRASKNKLFTVRH